MQTYVAYLQLRDLVNVDISDKFSQINDSIKIKSLRDWLGFDQTTCKFSEEGAENLISLIIGSDEKPPVIKAAAAGEANLRDLAYVIENSPKDIDRILEGRELPSNVKAEVHFKMVEDRDLPNALRTIKEELSKIRIGDVKSLSDSEKEIVNEIQGLLNKLNKLAN